MADYLAGTTGLQIISYRIGGIWGPLGRPSTVFFGAAQMVHAAVGGTAPDYSGLQRPAHSGDGIDLCYVKDCARGIALLQLAGQLNHQTYNVASGRSTTYGELADAIRKVIPGAQTDLLAGRDPGGPAHDAYLDISRIHGDTGYKPSFDAERAVADYIGWLRAGNER